MAKVTITITDTPDGTVAVTFDPSVAEMQRIAKFDDRRMSMAHVYAAAAAMAFKVTSDKNRKLSEETDGETSRLVLPKTFGKQ